MDAELVLDRCGAQVVARAERAVVVDQELRHQEQRDALVAGGRVGQPCQHEVDDVVGEVVLAVGDEDLLPGDLVGAVVCAHRLGAQRADIGAGLRLGQLHGAHPFAGHQLAEIDALELVGAVGGKRLGRAHGQHRADAERHRGGIPHLDAGGVERVRQRLAAPLRRQRNRVPAGRGPAAIGLLPARRHGDGAVLERRAEFVANRIERRDHVGGVAAGLLQHGVDIVGAKVAALRQRARKAGAVLQRKGDLGDRSAVGHRAILTPASMFR